jgi:hypothetical protein
MYSVPFGRSLITMVTSDPPPQAEAKSAADAEQ